MRPEWVKCIRQDDSKTFCGRSIVEQGWCFTGLEHAQAELDRQGRLVPCDECLRVATMGYQVVVER